MYRILSLLFMAFIFTGFSANSYGKTAKSTIADENVCLYQTSLNEKRLGIKENLLSTIAIVETGRYNPSHPLGVNPWPWTVSSVKGSTYHPSKEEALADIKALLEQGIKSIDVGCMQINLRFHGKAFKNVDDALDPAHNTAYAAEYLKRLYNENGTWGKAATRYHSGNPEKSSKYEKKLIKAWRSLKEKHQPTAIAGLSKPQAVKKVEAPIATPSQVSLNKNYEFSSPQNDISISEEWRKKKVEEYIRRRLIAKNIITSDL